jgi:hypothetical protein
MNNDTFSALHRVLSYCEDKLIDVPHPQSIEEDMEQVKGWMGAMIAEDFA